MKRESFIFYKSFYDSIKELDIEHQAEIYNAIFEFEFTGIEPELTGISKSIFTLIIPQLKANDKRWENGKRGGRPKNQKETKQEPKGNQKETKVKPNENENVNVNENDNENVNVNVNDNRDIYNYIEDTYGRTLNSADCRYIETWLSWFEEDIIKYAIDVAISNGTKRLSYVNGILKNWKDDNVKTIEDIKIEKKEEENIEIPDYDWLDEES